MSTTTLQSRIGELVGLLSSQKLSPDAYSKIISEERAGRRFDVEGLLAAAEKSHLDMANAMKFAVAAAIEAGKNVEASESTSKTVTQTRYVKNADGTVSEITEEVTSGVSKRITAKNLGKLAAMPTDKLSAHVTQTSSVSTDHGLISRVTQIGGDAGAVHVAESALAVSANGSHQSLETSKAKRALAPKPAPAARSAPQSTLPPAALQPCREGAGCRNKDCTRFSHPDSRPAAGSRGWCATVECRDGYNRCTRPGCWYRHTPDNHEAVTVLYNDYANSARPGEWARAHPDEWALLVQHDLVSDPEDSEDPFDVEEFFCPALDDFAFAEVAIPRAAREDDRGAAAGGHTNMCFYLSVTDTPAAALALKEKLAPVADRIAVVLTGNTLGALGAPSTARAGFTGADAPADTEVLMAYVWIERRALCVVLPGRAVIIRRTRDRVTQPPIAYVRLAGGHYTRLVTK